jgi:hypothetical protein
MLVVTDAVAEQAANDLNKVPWNEWTTVELGKMMAVSLDRLFPRPFYFVGAPSTAKSSCAAQAARALCTDKVHYHFIDDRISQKDPTEIAGVRCAPSDPKDPCARVLHTEEYRLLWNDCEACKTAKRECRVVLFYDEHNHAPDLTAKATYEPVHDASIGGRKFKRGVVRWLAGNREGDNCNIVVADRPLQSRVGWVYVRFDFDPFLRFVLADSQPEKVVLPAFTPPPKGVWHPYVIGYLREQGATAAYQFRTEGEPEYFGEPLPRTWEAVSDALWYFEDALEERLIKKIVAAFVGPSATIPFWTWCKTAGRLLPIIDGICAGGNSTAPTLGQQFFVVHCLSERFRRDRKFAGRLLDYCVATKKTHGEMGAFLLKRLMETDREALKKVPKQYNAAKDEYYSILV